LYNSWKAAWSCLAIRSSSLLTRRDWLVWGVYGVAGLGVVLGGLAFSHV